MKRNRIDFIKAGDGIECRSEKEIACEVARYFESLFTTDNPKNCDEILEGISRIIIEINRNFTRMVEK